MIKISKLQFNTHYSRRCFAALLTILCVLNTAFSHADTLRLATTTTLKNSGLLDYLLPKIEADLQINITHTVTATGQALRLGKLGEVDILLVHAPKAERKFVREGWGVGRYPVMKNDYLIVGPESDPVDIKDSKNLSSVFLKFTGGKGTFVSRGDQSGTHKKEVTLWNRHALFPVGASWYFEIGQSMQKTLLKADELKAYTLVDRGTWLATQKQTKLVELYSEDPSLVNVYSVILINSERHRVNIRESSAFLDWFLSEQGNQTIANFKINNQAPFEAISGYD